MKHRSWKGAHTLGLATALTLASLSGAPAQQPAPAPIKLGIVAFLSGPAAGPFGVPARNAAEIMIENLNAGTLPAPYNQVGVGGVKIEPNYIDEAGCTAHPVTELRNLVQRDNVDVVIGYISSGSCLAVAPVAEELQSSPCSMLRHAAHLRGEAAQIRVPHDAARDHG